MAALKLILSSLVSKRMGHTIAIIFLPRSYAYCKTYSGYPRVGFCLSTCLTYWRIKHATPLLLWSERCPTYGAPKGTCSWNILCRAHDLPTRAHVIRTRAHDLIWPIRDQLFCGVAKRAVLLIEWYRVIVTKYWQNLEKVRQSHF